MFPGRSHCHTEQAEASRTPSTRKDTRGQSVSADRLECRSRQLTDEQKLWSWEKPMHEAENRPPIVVYVYG